jgi:hypothetical protein
MDVPYSSFIQKEATGVSFSVNAEKALGTAVENH